MPSETYSLATLQATLPSHQKKSGNEQQGSASTAQGEQEQDIEKAKGLLDPQADINPTVVSWSGSDDPDNPQNWSKQTRLFYTGILALMTWVVTFASSVFSTGTGPVSVEFGIGSEVATLGTSLFVLGFGLGPMVWGPLSELYGRMPPLIIAFCVFAIFQIPVAVAKNVETIMICRFLGGFFGVAPLAIIGGAFADIWGTVERGIAIALFTAATFVGPVSRLILNLVTTPKTFTNKGQQIAGPVMGGFITQSYLGWRWTAWITLIMASAFGLVAVVVVPETYGPIILKRRAQRLRHETNDWALHAKIEEGQTSFKDILQKYIFRPAQMLIAEPILLLVTMYMALIYGILYLFFEAYPVSFQEERGWNDGVGALPFLSIFVGVLAGSALITINTKTRYARLHEETGGHVPPEERLILMAVGSCFLPAGLFWFGWTSSPHISWVPEVLAGAPIGFGIFLIFLQGINCESAFPQLTFFTY
jgi:DHA1 family multidrug resistance protein-like MFS transporter